MRNRVVGVLMVAAFALGLSLNVSVSMRYGEFVAGLKFAPTTCVDVIWHGTPTFYAGLECDY